MSSEEEAANNDSRQLTGSDAGSLGVLEREDAIERGGHIVPLILTAAAGLQYKDKALAERLQANKQHHPDG